MRLSVTRKDYFDVALRVLATDGHRALKMSTLCKILGVTTGSFYNYFGSWREFAPQLLTYWEKEQTLRVQELSRQSDNPDTRIHTMRVLAAQLPHESEAAIRAWSNGDPLVAEFQRRVDDERLDALREVIASAVEDETAVELLSLMGMCLLIGIQSMRSPVDRDEFDKLLDEFESAVRVHISD